MNTRECLYEKDIVDAVSSGRWNDRCYEDLRSHVSSCAVCRDVVEVVQALHDDHSFALQDVRVPSAGLVWWRAELRSRREAMRSVERPLTLVQAFAAACGLGVVAALIVRLSPRIEEFLSGWTGLNIPEIAALVVQQHLPLVLTLGVLAVLAPVALYFVFSDK